MENSDNLIGSLIIPIFNGIISFIAISILIFYFTNKSFLNYSYFNIIILCFILFADNVLRIITVYSDSSKILQYGQAFLLVFFDRLILLEITMQAVICYLGIVKNKYYEAHVKKIFFVTLFLSFSISLILAAIFIIDQDIKRYDNYFYCDDQNIRKKIIDTSFDSILLCVNVFCFIIIILTLTENNNDAKKHGASKELGYRYFLVKMYFTFFINILIFVESFLIIHDIFDYWELNIDLLYVSTCLRLNIFYMVNKSTMNKFSKLCCKKKNEINNSIIDEKDNDDDENNEDDEDAVKLAYKRTSTLI